MRVTVNHERHGNSLRANTWIAIYIWVVLEVLVIVHLIARCS